MWTWRPRSGLTETLLRPFFSFFLSLSEELGVFGSQFEVSVVDFFESMLGVFWGSGDLHNKPS